MEIHLNHFLSRAGEIPSPSEGQQIPSSGFSYTLPEDYQEEPFEISPINKLKHIIGVLFIFGGSFSIWGYVVYLILKKIGVV